jgi:hypothetical protein
MRTRFYPHQWLLCHVGLYYFDFELATERQAVGSQGLDGRHRFVSCPMAKGHLGHWNSRNLRRGQESFAAQVIFSSAALFFTQIF